eukprot:CAMPEP_0170067858 /NCGR_PEP_ID=MMETSP0019_2-20121128/7036_1 /TAXON_ID=98059 /ORGANISM="Dinobryon sp., Strain UTEXLB2267" /LENGTH=48 /DNA_ID= /DNA_START= /DNA_END= /DNA_ORIENTATION=
MQSVEFSLSKEKQKDVEEDVGVVEEEEVQDVEVVEDDKHSICISVLSA